VCGTFSYTLFADVIQCVQNTKCVPDSMTCNE